MKHKKITSEIHDQKIWERICSFSHYERTDKRKEVKKMKAEFNDIQPEIP